MNLLFSAIVGGCLSLPSPFCEEIVRTHFEPVRERELRRRKAMRTMILGKGWRQRAGSVVPETAGISFRVIGVLRGSPFVKVNPGSAEEVSKYFESLTPGTLICHLYDDGSITFGVKLC
jgi:hypothetical protein